MLREKRKLVIWPVYIDAAKTRGEGRIVPKRFSVQNPVLREIERAAQALGLNPSVEADRAYPRSWWEVSGRVLVDVRAPKSKTVAEIGQKIKEMRGRK
ncbi:MAG TPA: signal recognition particle protein Srp19 [Candidatus Methanoperedenaceae archaeon]|nr:signal recognition particle protein Srp19 [Candidatus Methanoperedenaceae archaeon]